LSLSFARAYLTTIAEFNSPIGSSLCSCRHGSISSSPTFPTTYSDLRFEISSFPSDSLHTVQFTFEFTILQFLCCRTRPNLCSRWHRDTQCRCLRHLYWKTPFPPASRTLSRAFLSALSPAHSTYTFSHGYSKIQCLSTPPRRECGLIWRHRRSRSFAAARANLPTPGRAQKARSAFAHFTSSNILSIPHPAQASTNDGWLIATA